MNGRNEIPLDSGPGEQREMGRTEVKERTRRDTSGAVDVGVKGTYLPWYR